LKIVHDPLRHGRVGLPEKSQKRPFRKFDVASTKPCFALRSVMRISSATFGVLTPKQPNGTQLHTEVAVTSLP
jgi:hypothetical protein